MRMGSGSFPPTSSLGLFPKVEATLRGEKVERSASSTNSLKEIASPSLNSRGAKGKNECPKQKKGQRGRRRRRTRRRSRPAEKGMLFLSPSPSLFLGGISWPSQKEKARDIPQYIARKNLYDRRRPTFISAHPEKAQLRLFPASQLGNTSADREDGRLSEHRRLPWMFFLFLAKSIEAQRKKNIPSLVVPLSSTQPSQFPPATTRVRLTPVDFDTFGRQPGRRSQPALGDVEQQSTRLQSVPTDRRKDPVHCEATGD
jgi:hypothetical protein